MSRLARALVPVLCVAFLGAFATACGGKRVAIAPVENGAFIWELKKGDQTLFLTGSVHLGKKGELGLTPSMVSALQRSDAVVLEADPTRGEAESNAMMMVQAGMLPAEQDLFAMLEPADAKLLEARAAEAKLPREAVARMRPWLAAMMLSVSGLVNAGYQPEEGTENLVLAQLGKPPSKPIVELEGAEAQVRMMANIPNDVAKLMLLEELRRDEPVGASIERLAERWRAGDADGLAKALFDDLQKPEFQPLYRAMFTDRNQVMAGGIERLVDSGKTCFVVVGAGHVVGPDGLLALLTGRGFTARQLPRD